MRLILPNNWNESVHSIFKTHHLEGLRVALSRCHFSPNRWSLCRCTVCGRVYICCRPPIPAHHSPTGREAGQFKCVHVTICCSRTLLLFVVVGLKQSADRHLTVSQCGDHNLRSTKTYFYCTNGPAIPAGISLTWGICIPGEMRI